MKNILTFFIATQIAIQAFGQVQQTFTSDNFSIYCDCKLSINETFITMAKKQGVKFPISAFVCATNENNPEKAIINNINIYNLNSDYIGKTKVQQDQFENTFLTTYRNDLTNAGYPNKTVIFNGVKAIEYSFDQMGVPTKAVFFIKNRKSYLIQVATRSQLEVKFNQLKNAFKFLNQ